MQSLWPALWKPGVLTIKLPKRLRLASLPDLANRGVSVLYVAGVLDEKYSAVTARVRAAGLPTELVPDAGHNAHLEASSNFAGIVEGVLAKMFLMEMPWREMWLQNHERSDTGPKRDLPAAFLA